MIASLIRTMRPRQWVKNGFIFAPLIFDLKFFRFDPLQRTAAGFIILCLVSGTIYIINDIIDVEKDRTHPYKRHRPIASGAVSKGHALIAAIILILMAAPISFWLDAAFGAIICGYIILQLAYSLALKNVVILDVMAIAAGFVLRVAAGVPLVSVERFSPWLYVITTLLALFLALGKRRQEIVSVKEGNNQSRAILSQYSVPLLDEMMAVVTAGTVMTYSFYTFSAANMPEDHTMMLTIPFVIYGIFRYLYVIHVEGNGEAPDEVVLQDRPLQISILLYGITVFTILYIFR